MTQTTQKIPYGWIKTKLGKICKNKGQYGANAPSVPYSPNLPSYIRITDIDDDGKYIFSNRVSVNISDYKNYLLEKGDIVFARTGATTGKTYLYNENDGQFVFAGFLIKFSPNTNLINPYYLKLSTEIPFYKSWIKVMSVRSGQPGVNAEEYAKYPLLLPPLAEQEKIAEILGAWDSAIEKLTALIAAKRLQKKGLMQKLLTAQIRLPGFTGEWQKQKLGCLFSFHRSLSASRAQLGEIGIPYLHYGDIHKTGKTSFNPETDELPKLDYRENAEKYLLKNGDVVFVDASEDRKDASRFCVIKNKNNVPFLAGLHTVVARPKSDELNVDFSEFLFQSNDFRKQVSILANGMKIFGVSKDILSNIVIRYPQNIVEQKAIADILSKADEEIDLLTRKLDLLQSQKKGLMQQLLTGKIRVKVA